jgi:hypothetical protein
MLIWAIDNLRLGSEARLKAIGFQEPPQSLSRSLRMKDKVAKSPNELLRWIKGLTPWLHTGHWRVLDRLPQLRGQRLILLIDRDSLKIVKETSYKIFTGLTQGTIKILSDPEAGPK